MKESTAEALIKILGDLPGTAGNDIASALSNYGTNPSINTSGSLSGLENLGSTGAAYGSLPYSPIPNDSALPTSPLPTSPLPNTPDSFLGSLGDSVMGGLGSVGDSVMEGLETLGGDKGTMGGLASILGVATGLGNMGVAIKNSKRAGEQLKFNRASMNQQGKIQAQMYNDKLRQRAYSNNATYDPARDINWTNV